MSEVAEALTTAFKKSALYETCSCGKKKVMNRKMLCRDCSMLTCKCGDKFMPYKDRPLCTVCWNRRERAAKLYG